jgi:excisionase family DNA binding protein
MGTGGARIDRPLMPIDPLGHLPRLLEVHEVAYQLKSSQEFVRRLIRQGRLPAIRLSSHWRVDARDLEAYIDLCRTTHKRPEDDRLVPRRAERLA